MNKKLMAAAVAGALAIPAVAFAQSSVTLYGTIDTGIRNQSKVINGATDGTVTSMTDGLYRTNRWGMKGSEDLGGGLKANFKLEGQYSSDTGAGPGGGATFARTSVVGLSSGESEFHLGRDYTVNFKQLGIYDPMSYNYTGIMPNAAPFTAGVRSSNMIQASTGFNGAHVMIDYALGEAVGSSSAGRRFGIGGSFGVAGFTIAGAYSDTKDATATGSQKDATIGGKYSMNGFTFRLGYAQTKWDSTFVASSSPLSCTVTGPVGTGVALVGDCTAASTTLAGVDKARMMMLGVAYDFSSRLTGRLGYYDIKNTGFTAANDGKKKDTILAVDYDLSKRTTAYFEIDHHAMDGKLVGSSIDGRKSNDGTTGVGVGIAHTF
jgi:predicted porin